MPQRIKPNIATLTLWAVLAGAPACVQAQTATDDDRFLGSAAIRDLTRAPDEEDVDRLDAQDNRPGSGQGTQGRQDSRRQGGLRGSIGVDEDRARNPVSAAGTRPLRDRDESDGLEPLEIGQDPVLEPVEEDPFAPVGMRLGSFLLFPELTVESVYHDNILLSSTQPESDWALTLTPSLKVQSDWSRHSLEANVSGERSFHEKFETEDEETFAVDVTGQLDIRRTTNIVASVAYAEALEDRSSSDFPSNAAERAQTRNNEWSLEGNQTLNRVTLTLRGDVSSESFDDSVAADGSTIDNSQRDYTERRLTSRVTYEFQPGVQAFVEASVNERDFERKIDDNGLLNGSSGHDVQAGLAFKLGGKLTGEASAGYALQTADDPTLKDIDGLIFNAGLEYRMTGLTTLRFDAASEIAETTQAGTAGSIERVVEISVEHRPRRNVSLGASLAYSNEQFSGTDVTDEEWVTGLSGEYLLSRTVGLTANYEHIESRSGTPGGDYSSDEIRMGVKVRR